MLSCKANSLSAYLKGKHIFGFAEQYNLCCLYLNILCFAQRGTPVRLTMADVITCALRHLTADGAAVDQATCWTLTALHVKVGDHLQLPSCFLSRYSYNKDSD